MNILNDIKTVTKVKFARFFHKIVKSLLISVDFSCF